MKGLTKWFEKKRISIKDCSSFEMKKEQAEQFFGGFKEYKPPIYEQEDFIKSNIIITDLFIGKNDNHTK